MSSIIYSGGTIVSTTFTCTTGTRAEIVTGLGAILVSAGWTSLGSGLYKSGTTTSPKSNSIRVRITDPGSGNCAQIKIENDAGDRVSSAMFLLPGVGKIYRVIACPYNFFCFTAGSTLAREFLCGGTLHIPDFLNGIVIGSLGWMQGNCNADGDSVLRSSFRTKLTTAESSPAIMAMLRNGLLLNYSGNNVAAQNLIVPVNGRPDVFSSGKWSDDSIGTMEAIMCFGIGSVSDESKRQGLIHNCMIVSAPYIVDFIPTELYDGHHWWGITASNPGTISSTTMGTLFVATD